MPVAVVTDSTADLPAEVCAARGIVVLPLVVTINGVEGLEGHDVAPGDVANALSTRRGVVRTSRPSPGSFASAYRELLAAGADGVVSVHLSARLSGTVQSAALAAAELRDRVHVVDARSAGMGLGFAVLNAAEAAAAGADLDGVRAAALESVGRIDTFLYVDTLDHLRRGGRVGAASALLGTALSVKPILHLVDGAIVVRDKVRTAGRALARLADLASTAAGSGNVDVAVHHLAAGQRAGELAEVLSGRLGDRLHGIYVQETGAAIAAHVGPGLVAVVVHRHRA
jgi:DegV family protein with EDD domain